MEDCLRKWWGHSSFLKGQKTIIESVLRGVDVIASMTTGCGKSLASHFPAVYLTHHIQSSSFSIIISPFERELIQQCQFVQSIGISAVYLKLNHVNLYHNNISTNTCFQFMTPSTFIHAREYLEHLCLHSKLVSIVVEDVRYLLTTSDSSSLTQIRLWFPLVPIVAFIDLGHSSLIVNTINTLRLKSPQVIKFSFNRSNVFISVRELSTIASSSTSASTLVAYLTEFFQTFPSNEEEEEDHLLPSSSSVIVIVKNNSEGELLLGALSSHHPLQKLKIHSSLQMNSNDPHLLHQFNHNQIQILITEEDLISRENLKPDIRLLIHIGLPSSLELFSKIWNRIGMDGLPSTSLITLEPSHCSHSSHSSHFPSLSLSSPAPSLSGANVMDLTNPVHIFCSSEIPCRRSYLLRYLETGLTTTPSDISIPLEGCCDLCDQLLNKRDSERTKRIKLTEVSPAPISHTTTPSINSAPMKSNKKTSETMTTTSHSEALEKALRVVRFDLCNKFHELAPYQLLTSDEMKILSLLQPISLQDLRSIFQWDEKKLSMIGEEIVCCIRNYQTKNNLPLSEPFPHLIPSSTPVQLPKQVQTSPVPPIATPQATAHNSSITVKEESIEMRKSDPQLNTQITPSCPAPVPIATMKRRRTEAVNASCGVVRRVNHGTKLKRAVSLPIADKPVTPTADPPPVSKKPSRPDQTHDRESEILAFLQSHRGKTLVEILRHFSENENREINRNEILLALRSLGEKCCVYLEEGGRYCSVEPIS